MLYFKEILKNGSIKSSKINFIDLAGSERADKAGTQGKELNQGKNISKSLSTFGRVINAIVNKDTYIPFRDSKLTFLLKESLGGNSKTTLLCTCSRKFYHFDESKNALKFAH